MLENAVLQAEKIHFKEFRILRGLINSPAEFKAKRIKAYRSDVGFEMAFNLEKKAVKADIQITAVTNSLGKNKEEADGFFHIVFSFVVDNLSELVEETQPGQLTVHLGLANAIASISYSTARGIILSRFQGTALCDFILPVISPNDLLGGSVSAE